jgi:type I restriction enzyme S subunit
MLRTPGIQNWIQRQVKGATFREITLSRLRELPVIMPPVEQQEAFGVRMDAVDDVKRLQRESLVQSGELFASLQHRAFRGEL